MKPVARTDIYVPPHRRGVVESPVDVCRKVIADGSSDHAIVIYKTAMRTFLSLNVMCSGEEYEGDANAFGIDPRREEGRKERFQMLIDRLKETADKYPGCLIALQEYPRRMETGTEGFTELLSDRFEHYKLYFGAVEQIDEVAREKLGLSKRTQSQLCMLLPEELQVEEVAVVDSRQSKMGDTLASRMQVLKGEKEAFINLHLLSIFSETAETNPIPSIRKRCRELVRGGCSTVYLVGDWNRRKEGESWAIGWKSLLSPPSDSHLYASTFEHLAIPHQPGWDREQQVEVEVNRAPIDRRLSNQAIVIYKMPHRSILSFNLAVDASLADMLGIEINHPENLIQLLRESANRYPGCVIALQGYPGENETIREELTALLHSAFHDYQLCTGTEGALCMLVPSDFVVDEAADGQRVQMIRSQSEAFLHVQLNWNGRVWEGYSLLPIIRKTCESLTRKGSFTAVIGGWNRSSGKWSHEWSHLISPSVTSRISPGGPPIDHLALFKA